MLPRRVRRGPANTQSIRPGHQAPDRPSLRCLHPGEPAGHRPGSGAAPRHLRYARQPTTAARRDTARVDGLISVAFALASLALGTLVGASFYKWLSGAAQSAAPVP